MYITVSPSAEYSNIPLPVIEFIGVSTVSVRLLPCDCHRFGFVLGLRFNVNKSLTPV
jgi:hypothetical protein